MTVRSSFCDETAAAIQSPRTEQQKAYHRPHGCIAATNCALSILRMVVAFIYTLQLASQSAPACPRAESFACLSECTQCTMIDGFLLSLFNTGEACKQSNAKTWRSLKLNAYLPCRQATETARPRANRPQSSAIEQHPLSLPASPWHTHGGSVGVPPTTIHCCSAGTRTLQGPVNETTHQTSVLTLQTTTVSPAELTITHRHKSHTLALFGAAICRLPHE